MATDVNGQIVVSRDPSLTGTPGEGAVQQELKNQQLNDALAAGTVVRILMHVDTKAIVKTGLDVVIWDDLGNYLTSPEIIDLLNSHIYNMGFYNVTGYDIPRMNLRCNNTPTTQQDISGMPKGYEVINNGEMIIDNFNASPMVLRYSDFNGNAISPIVSKIDAGSINGVVINDGDVVSRNGIIDLINSAFSYDSATNSLTIKSLPQNYTP